MRKEFEIFQDKNWQDPSGLCGANLWLEAERPLKIVDERPIHQPSHVRTIRHRLLQLRKQGQDASQGQDRADSGAQRQPPHAGAIRLIQLQTARKLLETSKNLVTALLRYRASKTSAPACLPPNSCGQVNKHRQLVMTGKTSLHDISPRTSAPAHPRPSPPPPPAAVALLVRSKETASAEGLSAYAPPTAATE